MLTRLLCLLALCLVLADARWHSLWRDDDYDYSDPTRAAEQELELHRPIRPRSEEDHLRELLKYRGDEEEEEEDDSQELPQRSPRHRHLARRRFRGWSQRQLEEAMEPRQAPRGKRHNRRRAWTEQNKKAFNRSRSKPLHFESDSMYEVEVHEAQNSSLCNYTVIPIPDPGGRVPRDLEHVRCNYVGSRCQDKGNYCCIQTYRHVEVLYENGKKEAIKVYSGCVCSLQIYGTLNPYTPDLDLDD